MSKITLGNVGSLIDSTTAAATINSNTAAIVTEFDNTLSRDGSSPNQMSAAIDMNSNRIINLPQAITLNEPVRLTDLNTFSGGGTISIQPLPTGGTTSQILQKNSNTNYDVSWISPSTASGTVVTNVTSIAGLKAVDTTVFQWANLSAAGRVGEFVWTLGNFTTHIATDTNSGIYVKANAIAASVGAWVRSFDFQVYKSRWFGTVNDYSTDNTAVINTIINVGNLINTLTTPGVQSAVYIDIEGGVKFASASINFLSSAINVFMYLRFFANSDTTKGVSNGGGGTNEQVIISVNSGYPGDVTGGLVAEQRFEAPLHPSTVMNVAKQITGADNHLGASQTRIPTDSLPARASYNIFDENVIRWRAVYENYGGPTNSSGVSLQPFCATLSLANVGSTGWPTIPVNGTVITGVTSGAKMYKTGSSGAAVTGIWITGTFVPGEKITDGVTTSTNGITGGGVGFENTTYPSLIFGVNSPVLTYGVFPNNALTAATIGGRLTMAPSSSSVATTLKETVTAPAILFTGVSGAVPNSGRQLVLDTSSNRIVTTSGVAQGATASANLGAVTSHGCVQHAGINSVNSFNMSGFTNLSVGAYRLTFPTKANTNYAISVMCTDPLDQVTYSAKSTTSVDFAVIGIVSRAAKNLGGEMSITICGGE